MGMKISEIITDKYKLRIPPTVYYELLADVQELEEEQEPTTKNDLVTLTFSKGILKYSCKDYVVYKRDWLRSHYGAEIDIMFGDSQYKEPTTKNYLSEEDILELKHRYGDEVEFVVRDMISGEGKRWE